MGHKEKSVLPNPAALLPIALFLLIYLGNGIYFEYISKAEGQMGFYVVSVVLAFSIALIAAFLQNPKQSFEDKIHICAQGIGDDNIVIMLFIFIMAGAFSGIASEAGGAASTANLLLSIIPGRFAVPGLFVISCLISMAMGTSVGTITVITPIACAVSNSGGLPLTLCVGVVVGGAMFGDNLSFISDTTIAATKTQGVEMKDKFRTNIRVALPAAVITFVILLIYAVVSRGAEIGTFDYNIWQALPYFIVLALSIMGINVFVVLMVGSVLFILVGMFTGSLTYATALSSMGSGISGMFETMIVTVLVASIRFRSRHRLPDRFHGCRNGKQYGRDRHCRAHCKRYQQRIQCKTAHHSLTAGHLLLHHAGDHSLRSPASGCGRYSRSRELLTYPLPDLSVYSGGICRDLHYRVRPRLIMSPLNWRDGSTYQYRRDLRSRGRSLPVCTATM